MLPSPLIDSPAEPFTSAIEGECAQRERDGVHAFIDFVIDRQGGVAGRTLGPCDGKSGHASGRAWDWMISAKLPEERAKADELIGWLLANDAEMFRRAGLGYIIWDRRIWSAGRPRWRDYGGRNPHTDHVHFSFNHAGADGRTSFYRWLDADQPSSAPVLALTQLNLVPAVIAFVAGFALVTLVPRTKWWQRSVS